MKIYKIAITGGPCGGKTSAMEMINTVFDKPGYIVLFVPEIATELKLGNVTSDTCGSADRFQKHLLKLQLEEEKVFEDAAAEMNAEKILIVCDRGALDNKAYMTPGGFQKALDELGTTEAELHSRYDAVFHLVTAADGAEEHYNTSNNEARTETPEEARRIDGNLRRAWEEHPHFRVIDNSTGYTTKINRLISEIQFFLGEPEAK